MQWNISMKDENEKDNRNVLLAEGDHEAEIMSVRLVSAEESKSGNPYFKWNLQTNEGNINIVTTLMKKKRWLLKQLLCACGIEANPDDAEQKYTFSEEDMLGKKVIIRTVNKENSFTNREGKLIKFVKSEVREVIPAIGMEKILSTETEPDVPF